MTNDITPTRAATSTDRVPGPVQGLLLISMGCLPVLGAVLLAPAQPQIFDEFADTGAAKWLVPLVITTPALIVGLVALGAGRIVDAIGRMRLLITALVVYALFGTAPLYLHSLVAILGSRVGVGVAEAAIMTCSTTLIADYFVGKERARYLGLQVVVSSLSAVVFIGLGGALAQSSWRTPFWVYGIGVLFAVLVPLLLWSPAKSTSAKDTTLSPVDWRPLAIPLAVTAFGGVVFYVPIVEIPYALSELGMTGAGAIGAVSALVAVATAVGAVSFMRIGKLGPKTLLPSAFGAAGLGITVIGLASTPVVVALGGVVASAGCGVLLPTLLTWVLLTLKFEERGRGTGAWTACLFIGQFASALVVVAIAAAVGGLFPALVTVGVLSLALAAASTRLSSVRAAVPAFE